MAKSIYDILKTLETETSVPEHGMVQHTLPSELLPTDEQFENEEALLEWAQDKNIVHACLQKGIQKFLIDMRATFKAVKKDEEWTEEKGQDALNGMEWTITKRPKAGKSDEDVAMAYLASLSEKDRKAFLKSINDK